MKKYNLVTTGLSFTRDKDQKNIYLGDWCFDYNDSEKNNPENIIIEYHSSDIKKRVTDEEYTNQIYENLLNKIHRVLNEFHKTNYSIDFWRVQLNPFLFSVTNLIFDRWESIRIVNEKYKNLSSKEFHIDESKMIPFSGQHFKQGVCHEDIWNYYIFLNIIKEFNIETKILVNQKKFSVQRKYTTASNHNKKKIKKNLFLKFFKKLLARVFYNKNNIVMINTGLPKKIQILTQLLLFQYNINNFEYTDYHIGKYPDMGLRKKLSKKIGNSEIKFENFLLNKIMYLIPTIYLEDFNKLKNFDKNCFLPSNPKYIISSTAHVIADEFKYWCAKRISEGSKLLVLQHGCTYGTAEMSTYERHEIKISNKFLTWGWSKNSKTLPFCNIKNINKKISNNNKGYCLLITFSTSKYYIYSFSSIASSDWLKYHNSAVNFYSSLSSKIKSNFYVRLSPNYNKWTAQKDRWKNFDQKIKFANYAQIDDHYKESRLNIVDHEGTPFLELIGLNLPVILIQKYEPININAMKYFNILKEVKIFHTDYISASMHIDNIWENVDDWWLSKKTQAAINEFNNNYSRNTRKPIKNLINILKHQIN